MLLKLKSAKALLSSTFTVGKLLSMLSEVLISLGCLRELRVNILVLAGECLDVLDKLLHFSGLSLRELDLFIELLAQALDFDSQALDLVLSIEEASLYGILFPAHYRHLMLDIREVTCLSLKLIAALGEFFGLRIKFTLNLISGSV
jgi:hypothetical protein